MSINEWGIDKLGRPCRDLYCMNLCFEIARKSFDPSSKCGCLAVDEEGIILSAGYNGPPQGSIDEEIPLTRPEKYLYFEHSERNCIYLASRKQTSLDSSIFYITGFPCIDCLRGMMQAKVKEIIYGPNNAVMTNDEEYISSYGKLLQGSKIVIRRFKYDEGLYLFNSRIKEVITKKAERDGIVDINFEWNYIKVFNI